MRSAATLIPARLGFPPESCRLEAWGRLVRLTSGGAELSTFARLLKDEEVLLDFELGGERLAGLRARVLHAEDDSDGRRLAELLFVDEVQRRALAKALVGVLARS